MLRVAASSGAVEWMRRQPQGRQTKQNARQEAFYKLEKATKPRVKDPKLELNEDGQRRMGGNILKVRDVWSDARKEPSGVVPFSFVLY